MKPTLPPILAAEDEDSDAFMLRYAFEKAGIPNRLIIVDDGRAATDYLSGQPPYENRAEHPLPALLLLDLKMPRMSGFDVLSWLAERPELRDLPAFILSSSAADADIRRARALGARNYFVKPHDIREFVGIVRSLPIAQVTEPPVAR
jgi:CheY-like chemotaxis protein